MTIKSLLSQNKENIINKEHTVSGWVQTLRTSESTFGFCLLNDGSNISGLQNMSFTVIKERHLLHLKYLWR